MKRLLQIAKWLWIVLLIFGVAWYLRNNYADVVFELRKISVWRIIVSLILLLTGRLLLIEVARDTVKVVGLNLSYPALFHMVSFSELGKYLPGGIWHFVGRAGYYRNAGLSIQDSGRAMFLELLWMIVSSALLGCAMLLIYDATVYNGFIVFGLIILWGIFTTVTLRRTQQTVTPQYLLRLMLLQLGVWFSLGISYWVLLPLTSGSDFALTIGAFLISWLIGFLTILAPGGIGTREVAITTLMLPIFPAATTIVLASIHRLIWIGVEILMGLIALLLDSRQQRQSIIE